MSSYEYMEQKRITSNMVTITFFICMLIRSFVVYKYNETTDYIDIPHIEINTLPIYIILFISFMVMIRYRYIHNDYISKLLVLRIFIPFIPAIYLSVGENCD